MLELLFPETLTPLYRATITFRFAAVLPPTIQDVQPLR
mgnify:CR=1 FL=1